MNEDQIKTALFAAQNGDRDAFGIIYDHFSEKIYRFIFYRVGHKELAEDIMADTFVKAWTRISQVDSGKALNSWIYQVAKNSIIDYYRVRKTTIALEEVEDYLEDAVNPVDLTDLTFDQKKMMELITHLPPDQEQVIKYKFFEDLTNAEIASIMGRTEGSIRVIQHRAIAKLRDLNKRKRI